MEKVNNTVKIYTQIITFLIVWGMVLIFSRSYSAWDIIFALKQVPTAISVYAIIGIIFIKWLWKWPFLQGWLIRVPNLQGTWRGELKSDWVNPETGKGIDPIPVILVIRQTFSNIKCTLMTKESTSYSTTADINIVPGGEDLFLTYNYTNRPKAVIRHRSKIHDGASILKITKKPEMRLEGEYWTSRKTIGDMSLKFESKDLIERF